MELHKSRHVGHLVDYLKIAFLCSLTFAVTCLILLGLGLMKPLLAVFLFIPFFLLNTPIVGVMSWLMAKGSNGELEWLVLKTIGAIPGMYCGLLLGGFVGHAVFGQIGQIGAIVLVIAFWAIGQIGGMYLGSLIGRRILKSGI